jgi:hypothetical protein
MTTWRTPVEIPVRPWFADHCFNGRVVLPAVETMLLLAGEVARSFPELDIRVMDGVRFGRFLELPPPGNVVSALVEWQKLEDGSLGVKLLSRVQLKSMTRLQEHGEIYFSPARRQRPDSCVLMGLADGAETRISARRIYRELVPFGPGYHTLQGELHLGATGARGILQAPVYGGGGIAARVGSPFPLDGTFHAACVLGQRLVNFVPFPVGFVRRIISQPTRPGGRYETRVVLRARTEEELVFDLSITDEHQEVYESLTGLRMRDVSGGTIRPPEWMKTPDKKLGGICDRPIV